MLCTRYVSVFFLALFIFGVSFGCATENSSRDATLAEKERINPVTPRGFGDEGAATTAYTKSASYPGTTPAASYSSYKGSPKELEANLIGATSHSVLAGWTEAEKNAAEFIYKASIYFYFDSAELSAASKAVLRQKADKMKVYPQLKVFIAGHCDELGSAQYNLQLGEKRAKAAYNYLISLGVAKSRLEYLSYGNQYPAVLGADEAARSKNRRAEFKLLKM